MTRESNPAPRWSVRTLLAWLVLACLLPGIIGATTLFIHEYREGRSQLKKDTIQTVRALAQAVDNQILRVQALAVGLAASDALATGDFGRFHEQARRTLAHARLGASVSLADSQGRQIANTGENFGASLPFHGSPELVRRVFDTGEAAVSDVYQSRVLHRPLVAVAVPVMQDNGVRYALTVTILPETLDDILGAQGLPPGWVATVFDSAGTIAARSRASDEYVGQKPAPGYYRHLMEADEGTFEAVMKDRVPVLAAFTRSAVTHWRLAIGIPQESLASRFNRRLSVLAAGIAALFAVGLGLAWLVGGRIARSFSALVPPAMALGAGKRVAVPSQSVKEAAEVARAMEEAARLLEKRSATLRESEYRLAMALKAANTAAWEMDVATQALHPADDLLFTMLGYAPGELATAGDWLARVHGDDRAKVAQQIDEVIAGRRESYRSELRLLAADGSWRWILSQAVAPERDADGRALRLVGTHTDITERKEAEAEIRRLNTELEERVQQRTVQLKQSNEALMLSNMELQRFAHATAHDLQTPLRSIVGFSQLLRQELKPRLDERTDEWLELVIDNTRRLQTLIQELLDYSRLDAQARPFEPVDLGEILGQVAATLAPAIGDSGAEVEGGPLPTVMADRGQMVLLLQNLVENGIKYNRSRPPRVTVSAERQDGEWVIAVADNGIGIDPKYHERIFEIFRRLHSHQQIPGTGIGLAICQRIVERHGGRLWVESRPGEGSVFRFSLPVGDQAQ
ncbi:MAG TPA: ATP-binding protein [Rhodocyclaceae bacterium]|nr:ATP-binding protein [Rhodocyclaceae bacterium]